MGSQKRGRGRPRREYHIRVRPERRETPDYAKLSRALLEYAAMQQAAENGRPTKPEGAGDAESLRRGETDEASS